MKVKGKKFMLFSIRNKIIVCFLVPMLFMIIIGVSSYQKASEGMSQKFEESTIETVKMAMQYIDMSCDFIEAEGTKYAYDADLRKYSLGMFENKPMKKSTAIGALKEEILYTQTLNPFISDIHIITQGKVEMLSTKAIPNKEGCFDDYFETVGDGNYGIKTWIDSHE